jgi:ABC-type tungstate transport system substrate-binding protein
MLLYPLTRRSPDHALGLAVGALMLVLAWVVPVVFGWWVGFRRKKPRLVSQVIPFGTLVGVVTVAGFLFYYLRISRRT